MPKGIGGSYDSSRPHTSQGHPEPHVDIHYRDERGSMDNGQKEHVSLTEWIWEKVSGNSDSDSNNKGHGKWGA